MPKGYVMMNQIFRSFLKQNVWIQSNFCDAFQSSPSLSHFGYFSFTHYKLIMFMLCVCVDECTCGVFPFKKLHSRLHILSRNLNDSFDTKTDFTSIHVSSLSPSLSASPLQPFFPSQNFLTAFHLLMFKNNLYPCHSRAYKQIKIEGEIHFKCQLK